MLQWMSRVLTGRRVLVIVAAMVAVGLVAGLAAIPRGSTVAAQQEKPAKPGGQAASVPVQVAPIQAASLRQTTTLTGEFQSQDKVQIVARIAQPARITRIPAEIGQVVKTGDTLIELDRAAFETAMAQAEAQLAQAKANLSKIQDGARPEDVAAAEAATRQAAERLAAAQAQAGAVRAQDLANARAAVVAAEARLQQVVQGPTAADLANAEAALAGAQARLQTVVNGPRPQDIDIAVQGLNQARDARARLQSALATGKETARLAIDQAGLTLQSAQAGYGAAKLVYDEAVRTGKDPNVPGPCPPTNRNCRDLTDARLRQYKASFEQAELNLRAAEQALESRRLGYEDAKKQEIQQLQQQDAAIQVAQATLDKLRAGATPEEIAATQSTVDQAQAALDRLRQPAREADVNAARAAVTQAQAGLARLQVTPTEVGAAEAALAQQRAVTAKAANPYVASDLEAAQAQVLIAEAGVKTAALNLRDAAITAPFDGVVAAKNVSAGALASPGAVLLELVSTEVRGVFTIEEAQVSAVKVGQAAVLRSSAYPGEQFTGTVTVINPTANSATRSFGVRIKPEDPRGRLMSGMFAEATLVTTEKANVLAVPEASVVTRDGKSYVFVIIDNKAQRREVAPGLRAEGKVEVTSGVSAGEQVVVVGQNLLNDGDTVTVRQP